MTDQNEQNEGAPTKKVLHRWLPIVILAAVVLCAMLIAQVNKQISQQATGNARPVRKTGGYDPALLKYRMASRWKTGFTEARGIALAPDGRVFVAGDRAVAICSADGKRQSEIALSAPPQCLAAAQDGKIFIGFRDHIEVYGADGRQVARWKSLGDRAVITSLALLDNDIYAADAGNRVVMRYDRAGKVLAEIGRADAKRNIPGLIVRSGHLDIAAFGGKLLVANPGRHRVESYSPGGDLLSGWGVASNEIEGFCGCCNPTAIALLPDGRVVTGEKSLPRVKVYQPDGKFDCVVAGTETLPLNAIGLDLAVSPQGAIMLLEPTTGEVLTFTAIEK